MTVPSTIRAGDSVQWTESYPAYPSGEGWALKHRLLWPTGTAVTINTTASGSDYTADLTSANTAGWAAGSATIVTWVEKTGSRETLRQQPITILPDLTTATTYDGRSQAVKALADARAALAAYMANGQMHVAEYDIGDKRMKFRSSQEIVDLINHYEREVATERALQAVLEGGCPGRVQVRF